MVSNPFPLRTNVTTEPFGVKWKELFLPGGSSPAEERDFAKKQIVGNGIPNGVATSGAEAAVKCYPTAEKPVTSAEIQALHGLAKRAVDFGESS
jgi:hypothetical protein